MPLFCQRDDKRIANLHLINNWCAIPDNEVKLEDAVSEELNTEDEDVSSRQVYGNSF